MSATFLQPFVALRAANAYTLTLSSETTANWNALDGEEWSVPVHLILTKVTRLGRRPLSLVIGAGYFIEAPEGGPNWRLRTGLTLLFPG